MRNTSYLMLISIALMFTTAHAAQLPEVENVKIEGNVLTWNAQEGATGYNILRGYRYFDTVKGRLDYTLSEAGEYRVVAFNNMGEFGSDYPSTRPEFVPEDVDTSISYNHQYNVVYVYKTCRDVGPGESCVAHCPESYLTEYNQTKYPAYMSGGGCSTSDIVEADAFVGPRSYTCTVPTYSGEVLAQAICPYR